jgi:hypothetical protein
MGFNVGSASQIQRSNYVQHGPTKPIGLQNVEVANVDLRGKNPTVTLAGSAYSKSNVEILQVRTFLKTKEVYITVGTSKRDQGMKGQTEQFSRDVVLSDVSVKKGNALGESWRVFVTNGRKDERPNDIMAQGAFSLGRCG